MKQLTTRDQIVRAVEALDFPTRDCLAASLWRFFNTAPIDIEDRKQLSRDCGYIPYCGFPLARSGKFRTMDRDTVEREIATNPLCKLTHEITLVI